MPTNHLNIIINNSETEMLTQYQAYDKLIGSWPYNSISAIIFLTQYNFIR